MKIRLLTAAFLLLSGTALFARTNVFVGIGVGPAYGPAYPVSGNNYYPNYYPPPPPPPVVAYAQPAPAPGYVWVGGYWYPSGPRYAWRAGYWVRPPWRGAQWVSPRYYGHRYYGGYWRR
ncbi:MAG: YXWGXW repeat-containing protein [Acidobacteriota bacterium]